MGIIRCENLCKTYIVEAKEPGLSGAIKQLFCSKKVKITAVKNIDIEILKGTAVGVLGMNGAGKSTLIKLMTGIIAPTSGKVIVDGQDPFKKEDAFCMKISLVSSNKSQLHIDLSAEDNFLFLKSIYDIKTTEYERTVESLTERLRVKELLKRPIRKLSFGERIKVEIIAALLHSPEVIFLDEPTIGMDVKAQAEIRNFLYDYVENENKTIILTSHNLEDIVHVCKKLLVINEGKLLFYGDTRDFGEGYERLKCIELYFNEINEQIIARLSKYGKIEISDTEKKISLNVLRTEVKDILSQILEECGEEINNVTIQEETLESLIKRRLICGNM